MHPLNMADFPVEMTAKRIGLSCESLGRHVFVFVAVDNLLNANGLCTAFVT